MARPIFLPKQKAAKIHESTLRVLERTGISLDHEEAEDLYLRAGATKDAENRILIPRAMVHEALIKAYRRIPLYDRDGKRAFVIRKNQTHFGPGSDALYNIDKQTRELRLSVARDIAENVRIADALSGFDFVMSMALPSDAPKQKLYAIVFAEMVRNTSKPLVVTATTLEDIERIHHIATIVAGGEGRLRQRPFFLAYLEPISPLRLERSIADRVLYCAEHDIPMLFAAGANCGGGAPITPEGGVVQGGAESLAGLVLAQLKNENAKFIYGANTSVMDMRTSIVCYGAPEWFRTVAMYADMGKFYNLPSWGTAGCSDSFFIDSQSAMEAYEGILLASQAGTTLAHDVGFLAHGALYDARMLVLTDEMIKRARHLLKEADLSETALAEDVIDEVARKNALYLAHPHTLEVFKRALWLPPSYINRRNIADYVHTQDLVEMLTDSVSSILENHTPRELPAEKVRRIDQYLDSL
jgi:trimethylamine--corrinoid protein Co-methyltransferase